MSYGRFSSLTCVINRS